MDAIKRRLYRQLDKKVEEIEREFQHLKSLTYEKAIRKHKRKFRLLKEELEKMEDDLQLAWGFEVNRNKHRFWFRVKSCKCPKMDNVDPAYFGGGRIISEDCEVHCGKFCE